MIEWVLASEQTALDAPKVGCARDCMTTDFHTSSNAKKNADIVVLCRGFLTKFDGKRFALA